MDKHIKTWLYDILQSIHEIESYFDNDQYGYNDYVADTKTKRAVERDLEIIGEAINRILKLDDSIKISNARNIIGTRNRIIHGYDTISDQLIWSIVQKDLPILKTEVEYLLGE